MTRALAGSRRFDAVGLESFDKLAEVAEIPRDTAQHWIADASEAVLEAWRKHGADFGFTKDERTRIEKHMSAIPLIQPRP